MEAFLVSTGIVALGEMGDKTQLLALLLAARFRKPLPIIAGILVATLANHAAAGWLGGWIAGLMGPQLLRWVIGGSFLAMAVWMLVPDQLDDTEPDRNGHRPGVFGTTVVAFFLAEMGDKTQIATVALAARYPDLLALSAYLGLQSRARPMAPPADERLAPLRAQGQALWQQRLGQLNLACSHCHDQRAGQRLGGAAIPQGHATGYPIYRLEWQSLGSLQRRLRGCVVGVRAEPFAPDSPEWLSMTWVHGIAAAIFALLGVMTLLNVGQLL